MKKVSTLFFILLFLASVTFAGAQGLSDADRARLQKEYDALQEEIAEWQKVLDETRAKKNTLQGDVTILDAQIAKAQSEIKQRNITVTTLTEQINQKQANISSLEARIANDKQLLGNLLKKKSQNELEPVYYILLSAEDIGDMVSDIDDISVINKNLQELFIELEGVKTQTIKAKEDLNLKKNQELDAKYEVELKKKQIVVNQAEKKQLLDATAKVESNYQIVLAERQQRAEAIRSALFDLRDSGGISFAKALEYADYASAKTGVRSAMILAILSQESDLGKNIGSCYVSNLKTGDGVGKNSGTPFQRVMYAPLPGSTSNRPNDTAAFEVITKGLNLNWATTPVSCPLGQTYYVGRGFGGAMGPSQFIPSTWQAFSNRLKSVLGVSTPNPWDPKHAITATSIYLSDLGAGGGTYTAERNAACKYYSGRACDSQKPANSFYGDSVVAKAAKFQRDIDFLKDN